MDWDTTTKLQWKKLFMTKGWKQKLVSGVEQVCQLRLKLRKTYFYDGKRSYIQNAIRFQGLTIFSVRFTLVKSTSLTTNDATSQLVGKSPEPLSHCLPKSKFSNKRTYNRKEQYLKSRDKDDTETHQDDKL